MSVRAVVLGAFLVACAGSPEAAPASPGTSGPAVGADAGISEQGLRQVVLDVSGHLVVAEVADTRPARQRGLMERRQLAAGAGMVFVYPASQPRSFWMKNTYVPLTIAYLDPSGVIVHLADMEPMDESPVPSRYPAMYALEMQQGWFAESGVKVGDVVKGLPGPSRE